jgi:hypothetical protein
MIPISDLKKIKTITLQKTIYRKDQNGWFIFTADMEH